MINQSMLLWLITFNPICISPIDAKTAYLAMASQIKVLEIERLLVGKETYSNWSASKVVLHRNFGRQSRP